MPFEAAPPGCLREASPAQPTCESRYITILDRN